MSTCLQFDIGNSAAKWRLVAAGEVVARGRCRLQEAVSLADLLALEAPAEIWVASVAGEEAERTLAALCRAQWGVAPWFARTPAACDGLRNSYAEPGRMGVDRWLAMLGARCRQPGRLCVVDAGSALTIDLVAADGGHEGGYIIPGPSLMERALLLDTDRVRFEESAGYALAPGRSTADAVRHGIALAQAGAVQLALAQCGEEVPSLLVTGGAGETLNGLLPMPGEWAPELVFEGLARMASLRP